MAAAALRRQAERKARELLLSKLTTRQQEALANRKCFDVTGSEGGSYRIYCTGRTFNVVKGGWAYCAGPSGGLPASDFWLAQKLLIESDERQFLAVAAAHCVDPFYNLT